MPRDRFGARLGHTLLALEQASSGSRIWIGIICLAPTGLVLLESTFDREAAWLKPPKVSAPPTQREPSRG